MAIVRSVQEYQALMRTRANRLRKEAIKTASRTATFMQATAVKLAPRHTGETIRGINKTKQGNSYLVVSDVSPKGLKGFKQNMWANQTFPHRSVRMRWSGGKRVVYGDGTHSISGTPRFFHIATLRARSKFKQLARKNTRKALQISI